MAPSDTARSRRADRATWNGIVVRKEEGYEMIAKTWVINSAFHGEDVLGQAILTVGITTAEWVHESGDDARPANAATFLWVVLGAAMRLLSVGLLPHSAVTEDECLAQIVPLLRVVRGAGERPDAAALFGVRLANGTRAWP